MCPLDSGTAARFAETMHTADATAAVPKARFRREVNWGLTLLVRCLFLVYLEKSENSFELDFQAVTKVYLSMKEVRTHLNISFICTFCIFMLMDDETPNVHTM